MSKLRASLAVLLGLAVVMVGSALAQQKGPDDDAKNQLTGKVIMLGDSVLPPLKDGVATVNVGGLVIIVIRDEMGRSPEAELPKDNDNFVKIGEVTGGATGGGFTWHLFKPIKGGETTFKYTYFPKPGQDGKAKSYTINVTK